VTKREKVRELKAQGLSVKEIALRVGVSTRRVYQLLRQEKPTPKTCPRDQIPRVLEILRNRDSWTWLEADLELQKSGLNPPALDINRFLREAGFVWNRKSMRWLQSED
jgi:transposase